MKPYDLILLSMSRRKEWDAGVVNRNFYVARELLRLPHIRSALIVDQLPHTLRRAVRVWIEDVIPGSQRTSKRISAFSRLFTLQASKHYSLATVTPAISERRFLIELRRIAHELGFQNILLWSYLPTYVGVFQEKGFAARTVFDAVDDWAAHPSYQSIIPRLRRNYDVLRREADTVFTVSGELQDAYFGQRPGVLCVPNGVDVERFAHAGDASQVATPHRPRVAYVGVIQDRLDIPLLEQCARARPSYEFLLVGPIWKGVDVSSLRSLPNVTVAGFVRAERIPPLLATCSVGIVPHRDTPLVRSMNPMKVYEYLAAGLPVVSTVPFGLPAAHDVIRVESDPERFSRAIDAFVQTPPEREKVRAAVREDDWSARVQTMWNFLNEYGTDARHHNTSIGR